MSYDIPQPIPQGSDGAQNAENCRISAITDELKRLCAVYEAQRGDCVEDVKAHGDYSLISLTLDYFFGFFRILPNYFFGFFHFSANYLFG